MPDLAERIRDFVETAQPTVTMDEVTHTLHSKQLGRKSRGQTHRRRWILTVGLVAAAIILIATGLTLAGSSSSSGFRTTQWHAARSLSAAPTPPGSLHTAGWQLVDDLISTGWQQNTAGPPPGGLACPTVSACYALSGAFPSAKSGAPLLSESLYVSSDLGQSWSVLPMPSGFNPTTQLSCASAMSCYVAGSIQSRSVFLSTPDGGHQWTIMPLSESGVLVFLSCRAVSDCNAILGPVSVVGTSGLHGGPPVNESFMRSTDGGATWTAQALSVAGRVKSLSCATDLSCVLAGETTGLDSTTFDAGFVQSTRNGGAHWQNGQAPTNFSFGYNIAVSCTTTSDCMAVGVTSIPNPDQCSGPNHLPPAGADSCSTSSTMLVSAVVTTTDEGSTWQLRGLPADIPNPQLTTLSCASPTLCWLGGQEAVPVVIGNVHNAGSPVLLGTTNGGSSWAKVTFTVPPGASNYDSQSYLSIGLISCPSTQACVALGGAAQGAKSTPVYSYISNATS
jgi:photosystem II stability/assembly factor-like uncharacterized protein